MSRSTVDNVTVMEDTFLVVFKASSPSSVACHSSVSAVELISVIWCKPGMRRLMISAMVTVLLMAWPIALSTTVLFSVSRSRLVA